MNLEYKGYTINKTGRSFCDYHTCLDGRHRWGTLKEVKQDIDQHKKGLRIAYEPNK